MFRHMLGLVRGRLYYNLLNWYRVLALLPGFTVNRRFMEQMMGVKEALPDALAGEIASAIGRAPRARRAVLRSRTAGGLVANHLTLNRQIDAFYGGSTRAGAAGAAAGRSAYPTSWSHITATCEPSCFSAGMRRSSTTSSR